MAIGESDKGASQGIIVIGFSFGIRPDGSPGACNEEIAKRMSETLLACHDRASARPWVGMQWEIFDALDQANLLHRIIKELVSVQHVAPPPSFELADFAHPDSIARPLVKPSTPAERTLSRMIHHADVTPPEPARLMDAFNRLLSDRALYERFEDRLDLRDLHRPEKGLIGLEKRQMPNSKSYPAGLRLFQARRINRLILETLFGEDVLRRGKYLNTLGVARHCFRELRAESREIERVFIFAHPEHVDWCWKNVAKAAGEVGYNLSEHNVVFGNASQWEHGTLWDRESAQVWCRSPENFRSYQDM